MIKIIKKKIKKKERFLKVKNVKFKNYLKIIKVAKKEIYVEKRIVETKIENITIKNILAIIDSNSRIIKY